MDCSRSSIRWFTVYLIQAPKQSLKFKVSSIVTKVMDLTYIHHKFINYFSVTYKQLRYLHKEPTYFYIDIYLYIFCTTVYCTNILSWKELDFSGTDRQQRNYFYKKTARKEDNKKVTECMADRWWNCKINSAHTDVHITPSQINVTTSFK